LPTIVYASSVVTNSRMPSRVTPTGRVKSSVRAAASRMVSGSRRSAST
jgi:hypothetical protein